MTRSHWQHINTHPPLNCDVAIVGGGIVGTATAHWLSEPTARKVVLLDAGTLGSGASGRNAGFVLQGTDACYHADIERHGADTARQIWQITQANRDLLAGSLDAAAFDWVPCGSWTVAGDAAEDDHVRRSQAHLEAHGIATTYHAPAETNDRLGSTGFFGSLFVPSGGTVDPLRLVRYLAETSRAALYPHHPVLHLTAGPRGVRLHTPHRDVRAQQVVLAVGPSLPRLVPRLHPYVRPVRAQMLATTAAAPGMLPGPLYSHHGGFYVRQKPSGVVLAGGGRHDHAAAEETAADATTGSVQDAIEAYLHRHFPGVQDAAVQRRWSGTMGFSPDGLPVVDHVPGADRVVFATGFTGHGMGFGVWVGRMLAAWVASGRLPEDVACLRSRRFARPPASIAEPPGPARPIPTDG